MVRIKMLLLKIQIALITQHQQNIIIGHQMQKIAACVLLLLLAVGAQGINFFGQVQFNVKTGAMCMDGSPYSIYTYTPDPLDFDVIANKLLVFFEEIDFGWCMKGDLATSLHECYQFITQDNLIDDGSSINWPSNMGFLEGILSFSGGGYFNNWHKVIIKSCDGGSFMGNSDPLKYRDKHLHFRGSQNVMQAVAYLNKINWLKNREEVVLVGSFNAGIAALLWSDYFKSQTNGKFRVIADGALFLNAYSYRHNATFIEQRMRMVEKLTTDNIVFPNAACAEANKGELWKCLFADELIKYIKHPVYFLQSLYDGWDISEVLGFYCTEEWGSLSECKESEREIIEDYHKNVTKALNGILQLHPEHGAFGISCVCHQFQGGRWNNEQFQVPMNSKVRPMNATSNWAKGISREIHVDKVDWPDNKPCARKTKQSTASPTQPIPRKHNLLKQ